MDGNFQLGHYAKDHDPSDVSLYAGNAYFVEEEEEKRYTAAIPQLQSGMGKRKPQPAKTSTTRAKTEMEKMEELQDRCVS